MQMCNERSAVLQKVMKGLAGPTPHMAEAKLILAGVNFSDKQKQELAQLHRRFYTKMGRCVSENMYLSQPHVAGSSHVCSFAIGLSQPALTGLRHGATV
jgi:hypothetical protein